MKMVSGRSARLVVGIASFAILVLLLNPKETWRILVGCNGLYVAYALALMGLVTVLRAQRWWMVSRGIGLPMPFLALLEITTVSMFFNLFLPGALGGDAYRAYTASRLSNRKLRSLAGVVIERVTGLVALMTVCVVATALTHHLLPLERELLLGTSALIVLAMACSLWAASHARYLHGRFNHLIPHRLAQKLPPDRWNIILDVTEDVLSRRRTFAASIATGVVLQLVVLYTYYVTSIALGQHIPIQFFFVFFPLIELAGMIPLTVNGMGVKEGLVVLFLNLAGVAPSFSMGLAILNRLLAVAISLVGGAVWLVRREPTSAAASPVSP